MSILSEKIGTKVEVSKVQVRFFDKVRLKEFYIEDFHQDTLVYVQDLDISLSMLSIFKNKLAIDGVGFNESVIRLRKYKGEEKLNLSQIIDKLKSDKKDDKKAPLEIAITEAFFTNTKISYSSYKGDSLIEYSLVGLDFDMDKLSLDPDSISADIHQMSFKEKRGLTVTSFETSFAYTKHSLIFNKLDVVTANSTVVGDVRLIFDRISDLGDFVNKVTVKSDFEQSSLNPKDLELLDVKIPLNALMSFKGELNGRVNNLTAKDFYGKYKQTSFTGDLLLKNVLHRDSLYIEMDAHNLITSQTDLENFVGELPEEIKRLGNLTFNGYFEGTLKDFDTDGELYTDLGKMKTMLNMQFPEKDSVLYNGDLQLFDFQLGEMIQSENLGSISSNVAVEGSGLTVEKFNIVVKGTVSKMVLNKYKYSNVVIEGTVAKEQFIGYVNVNDPNLVLDFDGKVDLSTKPAKFDFTAILEHADLYKLHFVDVDSIANISTELKANFTGLSFDELNGDLSVKSTVYETSENYYFFNDFDILALAIGNEKTIKIKSDLVDGEIKGDFIAADLKKAADDVIAYHFKKYEAEPLKKDQHFEYSFDLKNINPITDLFIDNLYIEPGTVVKGHLYTETNDLLVQIDAPGIQYNKQRFQEVHSISRTVNKSLKTQLNIDRLSLTDKLVFDTLEVRNILKNDTGAYSIDWILVDELDYRGQLNGVFTVNDSQSVAMQIMPSEFYIADSLWSIEDKNRLEINLPRIKVDNLKLEKGEQQIVLDGVIDKDSSEQLKVVFNEFQLNNINKFTTKTGSTFAGKLNGNAVLLNAYGAPLVSNNIKVENLNLNEYFLGDFDFVTTWNQATESLLANARLSLNDSVTIAQIDGKYYPYRDQNNIDAQLKLNNLKLQAFASYVDKVVSNLRGKAFADFKIAGSLKNPIITGQIKTQKTGFGIPVIGVDYNFDGDAVFTLTENKISFKDLSFRENTNSTGGVAKGTITHQSFKKLKINAEIDAYNLLSLNKPPDIASAFYGTAYTSGKVKITGPTEDLQLFIDVKTLPGTDFSIPLFGVKEVKANNFITFVSKADSSKAVVKKQKINTNGLELIFNIEVTPDATAEIILDQTVGDVLTAHGSGDLRIEISRAGDLKIYGDYTVEDGDYLFTLQNLINKKFKIKKGGTISWNGDPYNAAINLSAVYKTKASLATYLESEQSQRNVPVEVELILTGALKNPTINFALNLPSSNSTIQSELAAKTQDRDELNRQVFALLVLNSFVGSEGTNFGGAAIANSTELLSNQLTNWVSQISDEFDVGINYTAPGENQTISEEEVELALSKKIFDNRVTLNGNVGVPLRQNQSDLVGEVEIEVNITQDGRFRAKAFNRSNEYDPLQQQTNYTQGVGLFYRQEFDTLAELWQIIRGKKAKKEEETETMPETDTTTE